MTVAEVLSQLQSMRDEKIIAQNIKRGAGDNQFGVKLGDIRGLANKIKADHELGMELWKTDNFEARLLAMLIIKPKTISPKELEDMAKSISHAQVADWF